MDIEQTQKLDLLDNTATTPALSTTSDMPVVETRPDASPAPVEADDVSTAAPDPEAEDAGKTPDAESATAPTEEDTGAPEAEPKKQSRGVQKKLDELRRDAEDAKRQAQSEREERLRLLTMLEQQQSAEAAAPADEVAETEPERPNRADFPDDDDWDDALLQYAEAKSEFTSQRVIRETIEAERQRSEAESVRSAQEQVRQQYQARIDKYITEKPDFHEVAESPDVIVSIPVAHAIMHSDNGPALQYHLGSNPDEAKRIMALSPPLQLVELGKIESRLLAEATPAPDPKPEPQISAAPAPIKPLAVGDQAPITKDIQSMTMDEYKAHRKAQGAQVRQ
jgi:hypothetical protein